MIRTISYSEVTTALDCWARWDFRYGDQLAGSSLREKTIAPILSGGRAWGAAVAAWHVNVDQVTAGLEAIQAMDESLEHDAEQQREHGVHDQETHNELRTDLLRMLLHYTDIAEPVRWDPITERELLVPIPSRTGIRNSTRYKLVCYLDATSTDNNGGVWIEEVKLRGQLTSVQLIALSRQIRWYAWAYWRQTGVKPVGVWTNERLNEAPKPPRILKNGKPSHATNQGCTADAYLAVCQEHGQTPHDGTVMHLRDKRWQQRVPILFRDGELEEAGRELVTAAKLIGLLEAGELEPIRHVKRSNCNWCPFKEICPNPDSELIDMLFERLPAKGKLPARAKSTEGAAA